MKGRKQFQLRVAALLLVLMEMNVCVCVGGGECTALQSNGSHCSRCPHAVQITPNLRRNACGWRLTFASGGRGFIRDLGWPLSDTAACSHRWKFIWSCSIPINLVRIVPRPRRPGIGSLPRTRFCPTGAGGTVTGLLASGSSTASFRTHSFHLGCTSRSSSVEVNIFRNYSLRLTSALPFSCKQALRLASWFLQTALQKF